MSHDRHWTETTALVIMALLAAFSIALITQLSWPSLAAHNDNFHHKPDGCSGAVASEVSRCSRVGIKLLEDGGNAADAIVGTQFCIGVMAMDHAGIGGGGFMLVRSPNGSYEFIDFRETAPAAAFQDMYNNNTDASIYGGLASGVPGELRGLEYLHNHYGSLPWADLVRPAIEIARYGFSISTDLFSTMEQAIASQADFFVEDPSWAIDFAPNGTKLAAGEWMMRKRYAETLEQIAEHGPDTFYTDSIAEATIAALQKANGTMTLTDLKAYAVAIRKPAEITYRDFKLTAASAPSSGVVALSVMKAIEGYHNMGYDLNLSTHHLDEAIKFGYGQRAKLGDPSFINGMDIYEQEMINETTAANTRDRILDTQTLDTVDYNPEGLEILETPGTSHAVAADATGMAVTLTSTINLIFGSQIMVPETGVIMNNEMNDFSIPGSSNAFGYVPSPFNYVQPGKRPLSSISPTIVEHKANSTLYFLTGASGGSRIITATLQTLWNVLDRNQTSFQALREPRLHDQLIPNDVQFEYSYNNQTVDYMKQLGHNVTWIPLAQSASNVIRLLPDGSFEAAAEPRLNDSGGYAV